MVKSGHAEYMWAEAAGFPEAIKAVQEQAKTILKDSGDAFGSLHAKLDDLNARANSDRAIIEQFAGVVAAPSNAAGANLAE